MILRISSDLGQRCLRLVNIGEHCSHLIFQDFWMKKAEQMRDVVKMCSTMAKQVASLASAPR